MISSRKSLTFKHLSNSLHSVIIENELYCLEKLDSTSETILPFTQSSTTAVYLAFSSTDIFATNELEYRAVINEYMASKTKKETGILADIKKRIIKSREQKEIDTTTISVMHKQIFHTQENKRKLIPNGGDLRRPSKLPTLL